MLKKITMYVLSVRFNKQNSNTNIEISGKCLTYKMKPYKLKNFGIFIQKTEDE